jgi:electron transfer flavoprotein alpha subunit
MSSTDTLVIAVHQEGGLDPVTARLVGAARQLGSPVALLVMGDATQDVIDQATSLAGVSRVLWAPGAHLQAPGAETACALLLPLMAGRRWVLAAHTSLGRTALPRLAALVGAGFLADVCAIDGPTQLRRPMYAGSVLATVRPGSALTLLTLRASAFEPVDGAQAPCPVEILATVQPDGRSRLLAREAVANSRPDLGKARVIVAGGRGVGAAEHMQLIEQLADRLGGAVGASRAAVDAGFASNAMQIGQTGKTVAPALYMAFGISGAIQHLAGIKDADVIVAVNKDADAPIFQVADVGLVGDLFEVLPALSAGLAQAA